MSDLAIGVAIGVFVGNFLCHWGMSGDWKKGLAVGTIAAFLVLVFYAIRSIRTE
jgi:hypothetical protein